MRCIVSTIADEDLPAHFAPMSHSLRRSIQSLERRYYPKGLVVGETELSALLLSLGIAATVESLEPEAETIRRELIDELKTPGETGSTSKSEGGATARDSQPNCHYLGLQNLFPVPRSFFWQLID
jgi:hypothetical protein